MSNRHYRIGVDCRLAGSQHAGIGRYIQNLILQLPQLAPEIDWVFFFYEQAQVTEIFGDEVPQNVRVVLAPIKHYSLSEQLKLPPIFQKEKLNLLHIPHFNIPIFYQGRIVVTIHDLLWHEYKGIRVTTLPGWQYWIKYQMYLFTVKFAVQRAWRIFVPAETVKKIVVRYYPTAKNKIIVTKEGVDAHFHGLARRKRTSTKTAPMSLPKTLLYVGSLYPHKNVRLIIDALKKLPGYSLILVGTRNVFQNQVRKYVQQRDLESRVKFAGYLSDEELQQLYRQVTALIQPSLSEGFGLTGVEAMAIGVPVLASDIPLFKEIYQNAAIYFDPHQVDSFVKAIQKFEKMKRESLIQAGEHVAAQYNWQTMAKQTFEQYQEVLAM